MHESILLIEEDQAVRVALGDLLCSEGYVVDTAVDGVEGLEKATNGPFDLVILDVVLPRRSGLEVCRDLRASGMATPILILTVCSETVDKVVGLKSGADDYVTKPFEAAELLARIEVLLRRAHVQIGQGMCGCGAVRIDSSRDEITKSGAPINLTARESQLLRYLSERSGSTIPREELLSAVWGYKSGMCTRTIDTHICSLRRKLTVIHKLPDLILTVSGVGYRFVGRESREA